VLGARKQSLERSLRAAASLQDHPQQSAVTAIAVGDGTMNGRYRGALLGTASFMQLGLSVAALAQTAAPAAAPLASAAPAAKGLEEIVVTAQKRKENLQKVPISVTALSAASLQQQHIEDYDDISRAVPGLSFGSGGGEGLTNIEIRGISSTSGSSTVGIYLDDTSLTVKNFYDGATQPKLFDIASVEVLRGPQGTLYGASSLGGTVRFVTPQPDMTKYFGSISTDLSDTEHGGLNYIDTLMLNIPVIPDKFALRASIGYSHDSGYIDNYALDGAGPLRNGVNNEQALSTRITGKYIANDDLTITPSLFFQRDDTGDTSVFYPSLGLWKQDKEVVEWGHDQVFVPAVTVVDNLGFADITSVSSFFWRQFNRQQDGTFYNSTLFAEAFLDPLYPQNTAVNNARIGTLASPIHYQTDYGQGAQEIRLSSRPESETGLPFTWVGGVYFADQYDHHTNFQRIPGINQTFESIYGYSINSPQSLVNSTYGAPGITQLFPNSVDEADESGYEEKQYALFGQIDYDILSNLRASVGARYSLADVSYHFQTYGFYQIGNISPYAQQDKYSAFTPRFALSWDITPDNTAYASASKGFRLGGPTGPLPFGPGTVCAGDEKNLGITSQPTKFDSDKLWSYELGLKNRFLGGRLTVDGAAFLIDWTNIQQQIYLPTCGYYFTDNVGNAQSYGGEIEARFRVTDDLTLGGSASVAHSVITSSNNTATVTVGERVLNTPDATFDGSVIYSHALSDTMNGFARADYDFVGQSHGSYVVQNSNYLNPAYGTLNMTLGVDYGRWEVSLYGKNLTDNRIIIQRPEINTVIEGYTLRPLTIGFTARLKFGA
jgi:outer membrane receptor protein involved in Fe transport